MNSDNILFEYDIIVKKEDGCEFNGKICVNIR